MDQTSLFKACVKTLRTRNKNLSTAEVDANYIIKKKPVKIDFVTRARPIVHRITQLRDFLLEHKKSYLNFVTFISDVQQLNDADRDWIDDFAQRIITHCNKLISEFRKETAKVKGSAQVLQHRDVVIEVVENYLKTVCKIYSEQKAIRVKRALEIHKIKKIETSEIHKPYVPKTNNLIVQNHEYDEDGEIESIKIAQNISRNMEPPSVTDDDELSPEEMQMFASENDQLYNELNNLDEEVKQVENKVVHISELQKAFTEKVLQQEHDIERIASTVVGATENLKDANDQIRQAIQRNAGLRVWVLFFLLVMSFSLLFLDWYND